MNHGFKKGTTIPALISFWMPRQTEKRLQQLSQMIAGRHGSLNTPRQARVARLIFPPGCAPDTARL